MSLEASLGHFISPLVNVLSGVVVLRERLNVAQWASVVFAVLAVVYVGVVLGAPVGCAYFATSFSLYGLVRKLVQVEALQGLAVETLVLMPLALGYLIWCEINGTGVLGHSSAGSRAAGRLRPDHGGAVVSIRFGTRLIPCLTGGAAAVHHPEHAAPVWDLPLPRAFSGARAFGFGMIWVALLIYAIDGVRRASLGSGQQALPPEGLSLLLRARDVFAAARVDANDFAFVDEERHAHDGTGFELRRLLATGGGVAAQTRIGLNDLQLDMRWRLTCRGSPFQSVMMQITPSFSHCPFRPRGLARGVLLEVLRHHEW